MNFRGMDRARRAARWVERRINPRAMILIYHRVACLPADPYLLAVTPEHFSEHLEVLRKHYRPMRLDSLVKALRSGRLPRGSRPAVAVTLDDGYYDCLQNASPLFERHDVPATVFVVSGRVADQRAFWWDELESLFLQPGELPDSLRLNLPDGRSFTWELGDAAHYSQPQQELHRNWNYEMKGAPTARQRVFREVWELLHSMPEAERESAMEALSAWSGVERKASALNRPLMPEEVLRLGDGRLVEVGAHTVTHPSLSKLSVEAQRHQIEQSKADLESILGRPVTNFSYPHGQPSDFTAETVELVKQAGFTSACAAYAGTVTRDTSRFELPRNGVPDCDGETFARCLSSLFAA